MDRKAKPWLDAHQIQTLFLQRKVWIDKERETHEIRYMTDRHLAHTHRFIRRNYPRYRMITMVYAAGEALEAAWFGHDDETYRNPMELPKHVEKTPLFRALDHEMDRRGLEKLPT